MANSGGAILLSAPDFNDEITPRITFSNPYGNSVSSLQVCVKFGNTTVIPYQTIHNTDTNHIIMYGNTEKQKMYDNCPGKSTTATFILKTVVNGQTYTSQKNSTFTVAGNTITISPTYKDLNTANANYTGSNKKIIKYHNKVEIKLGQTLYKSSTLNKATIQVGDRVISTFGSATFLNVGVPNYHVRAEDSRGQVVEYNGTFNMVNYVKPTVSLKVSPDADGKFKLHFEGKGFYGTFGSRNNSIMVGYRYKLSSANWNNVWSNQALQSRNFSGNDYVFETSVSNLDYKQSYDFQGCIKDSLTSEIYTEEITVKATPVFDWGENDFNFNVPVSIQGKQIKPHNEHILWNGTPTVFNSGENITFSEKVSDQNYGIILVWANKDVNASTNMKPQVFSFFFPKMMISNFSGKEYRMSDAYYGFHKGAYIKDTFMGGVSGNNSTGSMSGISYHNGDFKLYQVIGV